MQHHHHYGHDHCYSVNQSLNLVNSSIPKRFVPPFSAWLDLDQVVSSLKHRSWTLYLDTLRDKNNNTQLSQHNGASALTTENQTKHDVQRPALTRAIVAQEQEHRCHDSSATHTAPISVAVDHRDDSVLPLGLRIWSARHAQQAFPEYTGNYAHTLVRATGCVLRCLSVG